MDKHLYKRLAEIKIKKTEEYRDILSEDSLNMVRTDIMVKLAEDAYYQKKRDCNITNLQYMVWQTRHSERPTRRAGRPTRCAERPTHRALQ